MLKKVEDPIIYLRSENFLHLLVLDQRVQLSKLLLVLLKEVESTIMVLWLTMFGTEDERALASYLYEANFLGAAPALV